jgi:Cu-Zn family superoxide dismutase
MAVAVLETPKVKGEVCFYQKKGGVEVQYVFTRLPPGSHGFHIHKAGDLRGEGCKAACDHWHKGRPMQHGGPPTHKGPRHTGDLGNINLSREGILYEDVRGLMFLKNVTVDELYGRSVIVHEDEDDYGMGPHEDSKTTGHSGARIACAVIGRIEGCPMNTRKKSTK